MTWRTRLSDGAVVVAASTYDVESLERAYSLGYRYARQGNVIDAMNRDHDATHQALARLLGLPDSPTLRMVADGVYPEWASLGAYEERVVFMLQSAQNGLLDILGALRVEMEAVRA